jgi:phosphate starvation-inducible PhoH-like protein
MRRKQKQKNTNVQEKKLDQSSRFHLKFLTNVQKEAWEAFQKYDVLFLIGKAGTGKTLLSMAFAINEILQRRKSRIILTRPIVEAGESLGYLPGDINEKVNPYMMPLYDSMNKLLGNNNPQRDIINASVEIAPLAFLRGRTFSDAICIFDEAQNANKAQLKLFLSRFDSTSKLIITGDPLQSDLKTSGCDLIDVMRRIESLDGIGMISFKKEDIVRHPLVGAILDRLEQ